MPAVSRILARYDRQQVEHFVEVAVAMLDAIDGDPDLEDGGDDELTGDERDAAYVEWASKPGNLRRHGGPEVLAGQEDDEDDDPDHGLDEAEPDFSRPPPGYGAGCEISDPSEEDDHCGGNIEDEPHDAHDEGF